MKAKYVETWFVDGEEISGSPKTVDLPFKRICARAIVVRRRDGAILGTLHREDGRYALPGGTVEDNESTLGAIKRELDEENMALSNPTWDTRVAVDYFDGYKELSVWHIVLVEDVSIGYSAENIETKWFTQDDDVWYPQMHEKIILTLNRFFPEVSKATINVHRI
jgi:8-oxo-dGTP pyrophosphatase MutT (NUDIX family)